MATIAAINNGNGSRFFGNLRTEKVNGVGNKKFRVKCASTTSVAGDPYQTLQLRRGASESEVKKAFRQLALKYHPDVCKGSNCTTQFHQIYQAYDVLMDAVKGGGNGGYVEEEEEVVGWGADQQWDLWDEWMGPHYTSYN